MEFYFINIYNILKKIMEIFNKQLKRKIVYIKENREEINIKINEKNGNKKIILSKRKNSNINIFNNELITEKRKKNRKNNININSNLKRQNHLLKNFIFKNESINEMNKIKQTQNTFDGKIEQLRNNKIRNTIKCLNYIKIYLIILMNLFIQTLLNKNSHLLELTISSITLKIKGVGYKNILGNQINNRFENQFYPNEIYINEKKQNEISPSYVFNETDNIVELIWNNSINNCKNMFRKCYDITEINLFNFDISHVTTMDYMFFFCTSLTSVNISNFKTLNLTNMAGMFQNCVLLTSLDLHNFDTSKVINMESMFQNCISLTLLNLSNFNFLNVQKMAQMFENCINLEYINLYNFNDSKRKDLSEIFQNIKDNIVICINVNRVFNEALFYIRNIPCYTIDCSDNWREKQKKIVPDTEQCLVSCEKSSKYIYEYNGQCYENCPYGYLNDDKKNNQCKCELENCSLCTPASLSRKLCTKCNTDYYKMENDPSNLGDYFNCYKDLDGYYVDLNDSLYKKCYQSCKTCEKKGNNITHNCLICNNNFSFSLSINNNYSKNCYRRSNEEILNALEENLFSIYNSEKGKSYIVKGDNNITFQVTDGKNELDLLQKGFLDNQDLSILDLGECETRLKKEYNINETLSLIYIKQENTKAKPLDKNIIFEVYEPINFTKLNLSFCTEDTINIYVKMDFSQETKEIYDELKSQGYDMLNINDRFYHDICIPYTYTNDIDILLSDRVNYIYKNQDSQCQQNCQFSSYLANSLYMNCTCNAINDNNKIDDKKFNGKILYESFYDVLKYSNFRILKCYKLVFSKNIFPKNYGSTIVLISFGLYLTCLIIFAIKGISPLKKNVQKIVVEKIEGRDFDNIDKNDNKFIKYTKENPVKKKKGTKNQVSIIKIKYKAKDKISMKKINTDSSKREFDLSSKKYSIDILKASSFNNSKEKNKSLDTFELNDLEYNEAIIYDKRSFFKTYLDFLSREHLIIFSFLVCNDYNLIYIKYTRFIFLVVTDMAMNVFFFTDDSMHEIFLNYGKYDFVQQIPQIVYTTIISNLLETFLCYLSLTDKHIYQIKNLSKHYEREGVFKILRCIEFKLINFYIFIFLLFIFYWYLVSAFCAVYKNTQIIFLKDALSSFILGIFLPFIIYLFPTTLRIISLKTKKHNLECLFKLSNIIPFF